MSQCKVICAADSSHTLNLQGTSQLGKTRSSKSSEVMNNESNRTKANSRILNSNILEFMQRRIGREKSSKRIGQHHLLGVKININIFTKVVANTGQDDCKVRPL